MRDQGWSGAAMLPYSELEYGGFRDTVTNLVNRFTFRNGDRIAAKQGEMEIVSKST
jgi:fructose 1,6-bisphosphate aldolase/phosphatase